MKSKKWLMEQKVELEKTQASYKRAMNYAKAQLEFIDKMLKEETHEKRS